VDLKKYEKIVEFVKKKEARIKTGKRRKKPLAWILRASENHFQGKQDYDENGSFKLVWKVLKMVFIFKWVS